MKKKKKTDYQFRRCNRGRSYETRAGQIRKKKRLGEAPSVNKILALYGVLVGVFV